MTAFRKTTPTRRNITSSVNSHTAHREALKADYNRRCGYCDDIDTWRFAWYEIDHFVPVKYLKTILPTTYANLVYACRSCNNAKRAHWPTRDEKIHNNHGEGFIDPCDKHYDNQFDRRHDGRIVFKTTLGEWMYNKLQLYKPQHEIIWTIEQLDTLIEESEQLLKDFESDELKDKILRLHRAYRIFTKQLGQIS